MFPKFTTNELTPLPGGKKPRLTCVADLANAMSWINRLKAHAEAVEAARKQRVNDINDAATAARQVAVDGESLPFEEYEAALYMAVEKYVPAHKDEIFEEGSQTARFAAGEVSWRDKNPEVELLERVKPQEIADRLVKRKKLAEQFAALLDEAGLAGLVRIKWELDFATIKRLFKSGALKKHQLPTGLRVTEPTEVVSVKPFVGPERNDQAA